MATVTAMADGVEQVESVHPRQRVEGVNGSLTLDLRAVSAVRSGRRTGAGR